jgi:hypothetical protein
MDGVFSGEMMQKGCVFWMLLSSHLCAAVIASKANP